MGSCNTLVLERSQGYHPSQTPHPHPRNAVLGGTRLAVCLWVLYGGGGARVAPVAAVRNPLTRARRRRFECPSR